MSWYYGGKYFVYFEVVETVHHTFLLLFAHDAVLLGLQQNVEPFMVEHFLY